MSNFIISLDFELYWGVRDSRGEEYFESLKKVHTVVPKLIELFGKYDIACTWATVGAICANDISDFEKSKPTILPSYSEANFSPYNELDYIKSLDKKLIFAPDLVDLITKANKQELASHTFSHYYALEKGQNIDQFKEDLNACSDILKNKNIPLKSLVFPRNQFNSEYLTVCKELGYSCFRGNPRHWGYTAESREQRSIIKRAFRLIDSYIPLSGSLRQSINIDTNSDLVNVPASLFLRPWSNKLAILEPLRLWRIKWSMTRTAKKGGIFHLWWHPHNFGCNTLENLTFLEEILKHYKHLNEQYDFESLTMKQVVLQVKNE